MTSHKCCTHGFFFEAPFSTVEFSAIHHPSLSYRGFDVQGATPMSGIPVSEIPPGFHTVDGRNPANHLGCIELKSWESKGNPPMPPPQEIRPY